MRKILLGGILGGLLMFAWGTIAHTVLPLGHVGLQQVPLEHEASFASTFRAGLREPGLYYFPPIEGGDDATEAQQEAWAAKYKAGPTGLLVYHPVGEGEPVSARQLLGELGLNILCALAASIVLLNVPSSVGYGRRVLLVTCFGLFATFDIDGSQWNWWGFPTDFFVAQMVSATCGALFAGLAIARFARP